MNKREINKILNLHKKCLENDKNGIRADLRGADLSGANLRGADLRYADLSGANLRGADLRYADLSGANLRGANLRYADLSGANLRGADLRYADLSGADLSGANLRGANLRYANLRGADLSGANLSGANLSGAKNLLTAKSYLSQFEADKKGVLVYKGIGETPFSKPDHWKIESNSFLEETVNPDRCTLCGSGVNFATLKWIKGNLERENVDIWLCRILWEDLADVVVPYNTDGKARCARLQLIKKVEK